MENKLDKIQSKYFSNKVNICNSILIPRLVNGIIRVIGIVKEERYFREK